MSGRESNTIADSPAIVILSYSRCLSWLKLCGSAISLLPYTCRVLRLVSWPMSEGSTPNCILYIYSYSSDCSPHSSFGSTLTGLPPMLNICSCLSWPICGGISVILLFCMPSWVSGSWNSCLGSCDIWLLCMPSVCRCGSWKMHSGTSPNLLYPIRKYVSLGNFPILTGSYCRLL